MMLKLQAMHECLLGCVQCVETERQHALFANYGLNQIQKRSSSCVRPDTKHMALHCSMVGAVLEEQLQPHESDEH